MRATVVSIEDGRIYVIVRRGHRREVLDRRYSNHPDLHVGDQLEVLRQTNNPYLVRVFGANSAKDLVTKL